MTITSKIEDKAKGMVWLMLQFEDEDHQTWVIEGLMTREAADQFVAEINKRMNHDPD